MAWYWQKRSLPSWAIPCEQHWTSKNFHCIGSVLTKYNICAWWKQCFPIGYFSSSVFFSDDFFFHSICYFNLIRMSTSNNSFAWKFLLWCNYFGEGDFSHGKEVWKVRKNSFTILMNWPMILYHFRKKHATRFLTGLKTSEDSFSRTKFALMFYEFHADNYRCMFFFFETKLTLFRFVFWKGGEASSFGDFRQQIRIKES